MARPEGCQHYPVKYEDDRYSYSESDSDSSSDNSPSLPRFQLPKARTEEKWLRDKRLLRKSHYGMSSRGHLKPTDSSSLSTIPSNFSSLLESTNEEDDLSDLYTPVQKTTRHRVPPVFTVPQELSPVTGDSLDGPPNVPSLRLQRDWRPQQTSTTTSFQPFVSSLPKTNPHHGPKFVSSTPRTSATGRIPMYSYNQIIEESRDRAATAAKIHASFRRRLARRSRMSSQLFTAQRTSVFQPAWRRTSAAKEFFF